jgi:hypothetical protein
VAEPTLSVIVVAQRRADYLPESLRSALEQTLSPAEYEILLISNLAPETVAGLPGVAEGRVRALPSPDESLGPKVADGIAAAHGRVLCFLEDDDAFEPGKLAAVIERFRADPRLGFYRHSMRAVGPDGRTLSPPFFRSQSLERLRRRGRVEVPARRPRGNLRELAHLYPGFNNSSIAVRREVLAGRLAYLRRVELAVDEFLFFAALASPFSLRLDAAELTRYRLHPANASLPPALSDGPVAEAFAAYAESNVAALAVVREMVAGDPDVERLATASWEVQRAIVRLRHGPAERAAMLRAVARLGSRWDTYLVRTFLPLLPLGLLYTISPRSARRLYWCGRARFA